ncbi:MAG: DUF4338 domain-containing protein [Deltaproteobacteria bacterium]|nr:DUF4338 domain-containing protein [Deltaproteobacteria bacterium]
MGVRDRFIGRNATTRKKNHHLIAYQSRFLILPWVQVPHLTSHLPALHQAFLERHRQQTFLT